jgi:regulator of protease activity HflC (stomatin/prohibitin superfamily)
VSGLTIIYRPRNWRWLVNEFRRSFDENMKRQRDGRAREIQVRQQALAAERDLLGEQRKRYQQELDRLKKLSTELGRLGASRQLVDFIRQRDASGDYRSQLGTIARASQDFKRLSLNPPVN